MASPLSGILNNISIDAYKFDKQSVYLTDARRNGIMLRDRRLTLRSHSALSCFFVEVINSKEFILQSADFADQTTYVKVGDRGSFYANASRNDAQKFQLGRTRLGDELILDGRRPAVFDYYYDVSVGQWESGRSSIPILIFGDLSDIWGQKPLTGIEF